MGNEQNILYKLSQNHYLFLSYPFCRITLYHRSAMCTWDYNYKCDNKHALHDSSARLELEVVTRSAINTKATARWLDIHALCLLPLLLAHK